MQHEFAKGTHEEHLAVRDESLKASLDKSLGTATYDVRPTPEQIKQVLKDRARALAQETDRYTDGDIASLSVVEFLLGQERYAIETAHVREIYRMKELTPIPCTPPFVLGIINVRGVILAVIDVRNLFDLSQAQDTERDEVVIIHSGGRELGILTDGIHGVRSISLSDVHTGLSTLTGVRAKYLRGSTSDQLLILDADKLLSSQDGTGH